MDSADQIWNRATQGGSFNPRRGDAALSAALSFHSLVMNGGVLHAFEVLSVEELDRARDGFAWLTLTDVANFLDVTGHTIAGTDEADDDALDALEVTTDDDYQILLPDDQALEDAFRQRLADDADAFNPL